jgi:hypothetical protein
MLAQDKTLLVHAKQPESRPLLKIFLLIFACLDYSLFRCCVVICLACLDFVDLQADD